MTRIAIVLGGYIALIGFMISGLAVAQDGDIDVDSAATIDDIDRQPERCIRVGSIDETHIVDDQTILFYMRSDVVYQNVLRSQCRGLKREDRFSYKTLAGNLCRTDAVTVLRTFAGGFEPGVTCGLGPFVRISEEEADLLRYGERPLISEDAVEVPQDEEDSD